MRKTETALIANVQTTIAAYQAADRDFLEACLHEASDGLWVRRLHELAAARVVTRQALSEAVAALHGEMT